MKREELQKTLQSLHAELNDAPTVDGATRDLLVQLANDIQRLSEQEANESAEQVEPLSERVSDLVLKFETDHPQLTRALNQVSAALANLGI
jgi:hypothetical protein